MKEISLYEIVKGRLLLTEQGVPARTRVTVYRIINRFPSFIRKMNHNNVLTAYISEEDLEGWNLPLKK